MEIIAPSISWKVKWVQLNVWWDQKIQAAWIKKILWWSHNCARNSLWGTEDAFTISIKPNRSIIIWKGRVWWNCWNKNLANWRNWWWIGSWFSWSANMRHNEWNIFLMCTHIWSVGIFANRRYRLAGWFGMCGWVINMRMWKHAMPDSTKVDNRCRSTKSKSE